MGADGSNDNGRGRPDRPRSSPSGDTITPEEVERRCYNWAEAELEGSTWPDSSWMDKCPCEEAFYAGTYIASCERTTTGTLPPSGAAPAPLPPRNGSPGASSPAADSEAGIFMLVYAVFAAVSFLALVGVSWWWKREGERRRADEAIAAELANPWNVMARMRAGEGGGSRGSRGTNTTNNGTKHSTQSTTKRGSIFGLFFENPTGSVVFGKELAVLDDPEAVAYVYGPGDDDDDTAVRGKRVDDGDGSSSSSSSSSSASSSTSSSTRARTYGEVRVTMLDDDDAPDVRTYDGADTRRHGSRLAGAQLAADSEVIEISVDGSGSSSSSVNGSLSSGGSGEASRRDTRGGSSSSSSSSSSSRGTSVVGLAALGMVNPDNYLPNSRQNSRGRQNGGRLRSSQMWGDCDTDTDEEDAPSRG